MLTFIIMIKRGCVKVLQGTSTVHLYFPIWASIYISICNLDFPFGKLSKEAISYSVKSSIYMFDVVI